jgi:hypothetical protein
VIAVLKRQGLLWGREWLQYLIVADERVRIVELEPAGFGSAFGWNLTKTIDQGPAEWPGMTAESILAFKARNPDDCDRELAPGEADRILEKHGFEVVP